MNKIVIKYNTDDILNLIKKDVTETFNDRPNYKLFIDEVKFDRYFSDGQRLNVEAHADISFEKIVEGEENQEEEKAFWPKYLLKPCSAEEEDENENENWR